MPAPCGFLNAHEAMGQLMNHPKSPETVIPTQAQPPLGFWYGQRWPVNPLRCKVLWSWFAQSSDLSSVSVLRSQPPEEESRWRHLRLGFTAPVHKDLSCVYVEQPR